MYVIYTLYLKFLFKLNSLFKFMPELWRIYEMISFLTMPCNIFMINIIFAGKLYTFEGYK